MFEPQGIRSLWSPVAALQVTYRRMSESITTESIIGRHDRFMSINYPRYPIAMARGEGCHLWDTDGKRYLDLFAGFGSGLLGHCHPALVDAVMRQAGTLWHSGNLFHNEPQTRAAEAIARHGFDGRSYFCHAGADANEAAIKLARLYGNTRPGPAGKRFKVISCSQSFHGRTFGTMPATGQPAVAADYEPHLPGFVQVLFNNLDAVRQQIDDQTVAILVEPIQGEGGVNVPDDDYLPALRRLCDERDLLLICDEVWTGCGRTGQYFAHQHWLADAPPDVMTLAKGVGGGLPVGVMCAKPNLAELNNAIAQGTVRHASTLGGNCLSMAVTAAIFDVLERDQLVQHAAELGQHAMNRLGQLAGTCHQVTQVRGQGLFIGVELTTAVKPIVQRCLELGVNINGTQETVLRLAPPLVISKEQLDEGLDVIECVVAAAD